jgi:hypothetical protein
MRKSYVVLILAVAVSVSGCIGGSGNEDDSTAADHSVACSSLGINVPYANGESIQVVNIGRGSFGNVTVTWDYANGGTITKSFEMPDPKTSKTFSSNSSGTINGAKALHTDCPSVTGSY